MAKITMTVPKTAEQLAYYARFGGLAKVLRAVSFLFLIGWAAADFMGLTQLILPQYQFLSYAISALVLLISHTVLLFSSKAIGYDLMDGSGQLESGWFILLPIIITCAMLWLSVRGSTQLIEKYLVHTPQYYSDSVVVLQRNAQVANFDGSFKNDSNRISKRFALLSKATRDSFNQVANKLARIKTYDANDVRARKNAVNAQYEKRDIALTQLDLRMSDEITQLSSTLTQNVSSLDNNFKTKSNIIASHNMSEKAKNEADMASVDGNAYFFSLSMCLLFWICTIVGCRIDTKSGIKPIHDYTQSDGHDVFSVVKYVISDIFKSRVNNFSIGVHNRWAVDYKHLATQKLLNDPTPPNALPLEPVVPIIPPIVPPTNPTAPPDGGGNGGGNTPFDNSDPSKPIKWWVENYRCPFKDIEDQRVVDIISANPIDGIDEMSWIAALMDINPTFRFFDNGCFVMVLEDEQRVEKLAKAYNTPRQTPPPPHSNLAFEFQEPKSDKTVITDGKSVITDSTTVITDLSQIDYESFEYGDHVLKALKRAANVEVRNWENKNGKPSAIKKRCLDKQKELNKAIRDLKASKPIQVEVSNYFMDNITPIISSKIQNWNKEADNV